MFGQVFLSLKLLFAADAVRRSLPRPAPPHHPAPSSYVARRQRCNPAMTTTMSQPGRCLRGSPPQRRGLSKKKRKKGWKHKGNNVWRGGKSAQIAAERKRNRETRQGGWRPPVRWSRLPFYSPLSRAGFSLKLSPVNQADARSEGFYFAWKCVICGVPMPQDGRRDTSGHP